jgi:hypothetical protein
MFIDDDSREWAIRHSPSSIASWWGPKRGEHLRHERPQARERLPAEAILPSLRIMRIRSRAGSASRMDASDAFN